MGKFFHEEGGRRYRPVSRKLSNLGGECRKDSRRRTAHTHVRPSVRQLSGLSASPFRLVFEPIRRRFPAVAAMAEALQIVFVCKQFPSALVVYDVVHVGGAAATPKLSAFPAPRFPAQLLNSQILCPYVCAVHPAVSFRLITSPILLAWCRLVRWAIPIRHQGIASRIPAGAERLVCHGLSPPRPNKNAGANNTHDLLALSLAPAFYALACDIQDNLSFAVPAVNRQCRGGCVGPDMKQPFVLPAYRAMDPFAICSYYTTAVM